MKRYLFGCFPTKLVFDPEDGRFRIWKQTFSESTQKTGLMTWGSKLACGHSKGSKKRLSPSMRGSGPRKSQKKHFWPWRWWIQLLKTNIFWIYTKNWLKNMGVRSGLRPLQGVQKQGLPSMGGGADPQESKKPRFDPENQGETFISLPWAGSQLLFLTSMAKKRFINV